MTSEITKAKALKTYHLFKNKSNEKAKKQHSKNFVLICLLNQLQRNKRKQK